VLLKLVNFCILVRVTQHKKVLSYFIGIKDD
jgi:hypothetical protein